MEYRSIFLLQNQYPNIAFYETQDNLNIKLDGIYPQNSIEFTIPSLDDLEIVEETTFRFILAIKETSISDETRYFTSPVFYEDLLSSKADSNPYHLQVALDAGLFVKINLDKQIELFNQLKLIDLGTGVKQNQNLFLFGNNTVDYVVLVQYIDWLVSRVDPLDNDTNGVIPVEKIADFEIGKYDPNTGEFISLEDQSVSLQNRITTLEEELSEIEEAIQAITGDLPSEPKKRKTSVLEIVSLGLGALSVVQGATAAVKTLGKASSAAKGVQDIVKTSSSIRTIPKTVQPAIKAPDFSKILPAEYILTPAVTSTAVKATSKTLGQFAKSTIASSKKIINSVGKTASKVGKTSAKLLSESAKFVSKQAGTKLGQAVIGAGVTAVASKAAGEATNSVQTKKAQTDIILKSVAKSAAVEVGKVIAKKVATKVLTGAAAKVLGAATGPIGAGIMAAVGIVKFFVNKKKEKKEFEKQKAEYDKVMGELERLTKRKEDIEAEIAGILSSGKLKLAREFDERFSSTQKYFANIGKSIFEKTLPEPIPQPALGG